MYLLARQFWITGNIGDKRREERVMRICGKAVELDPHYADAWALLAIAQSSLRYNFEESVDDGFVAANAALSIDPSIAEAYCALARRLSEQGRYDEAAEEIGRGLRLDPESWEVNKEAGRLALHQRRIEDATRHYRKATELVESDFHAWALLVTCLQAAGDADGVKHGATHDDQPVAKGPQRGPQQRRRLGHRGGRAGHLRRT